MATPIKYSDEQLLPLLKARQADAFTFLYDNFAPQMYGVISRITGSDEMTQEVLQNSFKKIWENIESHELDHSRLHTWIFNTARSEAYAAMNLLNKNISHKTENEIDAIQDQNSDAALEVTPYKQLINKLKPEHIVLINLIYFKGFSLALVADKTGMQPATIKLKIRTALAQLRDLLKTK